MFPGERTVNGHFIGIGSDVTRNATILVEDVKVNAVVISEASLIVLCDNRAKETRCDEAARTHVIVESTNTGTVKIVNSALWGPAKVVTRVEGSGTVHFVDSLMMVWGCPVDTPPCLVCHGCGGNATTTSFTFDLGGNGTITVRGCEFRQAITASVALRKDLRRAIVSDNLCGGDLNVERESNMHYARSNPR